MSNRPKSFENLLDQYLFRMCTTYGYCVSAIERKRLVHEIKWVDEAHFVERLMRADGLTPEQHPKHFDDMMIALRNMIVDFNAAT